MTTHRSHHTDILHLCFGGLGGQFGVVRGLAAAMTPLGLRSAAVSYTPPGEHLRDPALWRDFEAVRFVDKNHRIDLSGSRQIGRAIRELRPRAILLHSAYATLPTLRARMGGGVRVGLLVEHTPLAIRTRGEDLRSLLALLSARGVVLLIDEYAAQYPLRHALKVLKSRVVVIPNGIDTTRFVPAARVDGSVIGMAARLNPLKDVATLISAAEVLDRRGITATVRIAGDGPSMHQLQQQIEALGLQQRVRLDGMLDEGELADWLRDLDVYVHASHGETMSTSVLQAFATGLPCVVSDVPGLTSLADGPDGEGVLLVPGHDATTLANVIADLLADPERRRCMGAVNRRRAVRDHGLSKMADQYLALLEHLDSDGPWSEARGRRTAASD